VKIKWILLALIVVAAGAGLWLWQGKSSSSALGKSAYTLTGEILDYGPRPPASEALGQVKNHLKDKLEAAGWAVSFQEFERDTPVGNVRFSNLRARFNTRWDAPVKGLLCAHIDSKLFKDKRFLGADDAASACAAVVEIAGYLAKSQPKQAAQLELVLFDGEEAFAKDMTILDGLYGSRHYANVMRAAEKKPEFGILLDMIGHKDLSIAIPSDSPAKLSALMFSVAEKRNVRGHFGTAPGPIMDDHLPLNLIGIPTLDIIGDFSKKNWWHTPGDSLGIISADSLSISIGVVLGMLDELLEGS